MLAKCVAPGDNAAMTAARNGTRRPWAAYAAVGLTVMACVAAVCFRGALRGRYYAWQIARPHELAARAAALNALCRLGPEAAWGLGALLRAADAETRQLGVLALPQSQLPDASQRLAQMLRDADPDVRRLAAVGLARRHDDSVVPTLTWLYRTGSHEDAEAACVALEYLRSEAAVEALFELAAEPAEACRRAALVDALGGIGTPACVPALVRLVDDEALCDAPRRPEVDAARVLRAAGLAVEAGRINEAAAIAAAASAPTTRSATLPIGARAAEALHAITGLAVSRGAAGASRAQAVARWQAWAEEHGVAP